MSEKFRGVRTERNELKADLRKVTEEVDSTRKEVIRTQSKLIETQGLLQQSELSNSRTREEAGATKKALEDQIEDLKKHLRKLELEKASLEHSLERANIHDLPKMYKEFMRH